MDVDRVRTAATVSFIAGLIVGVGAFGYWQWTEDQVVLPYEDGASQVPTIILGVFAGVLLVLALVLTVVEFVNPDR
jgi:uncharacterized protein involved in exopolysaccharide biosynthesis